MIRKFWAAALFVFLVAGSITRAVDAQVRSISTSGEAVVYVTPNQVTVTLAVTTYNAELGEAVAANEKSAQSMLKAVKDASVEDKHISTDNLNVQIQYKENYGPQHGVAGYLVQRTYAIKLTDTKIFEKVVQAALKNGANQVQGVSFETTDLRKYRDQARQMAAKAAKEKAVALATELDAKVGPARTIGEGGNSLYFGGYGWNGRANNFQAQNSNVEAAGGEVGGETLPLGQIAIRANVSVTFDLRD